MFSTFKPFVAASLILGSSLLLSQGALFPQETSTPKPDKPAAVPPKPGDKPPSASRRRDPATMPVETLKMLGKERPPDPVAVARGQKNFVTNCAFCHGSSATGGEGGPDLVRSVLVLHDVNGSTIGPVVVEGRPSKGMPKFPMSAAQIGDLSAFLHHQTQARADRGSYEIHNVVTGDAKAGEAYFSQNCASCHSATGDLAGVAAKYEPVALQSRFLYPRTRSFDGSGPAGLPSKVAVTLPSGETVSGTLKHLDDFNVALYDDEGSYRSWEIDRSPGIKVEVKDPLAGHIDLLQKYSDADMHNILAYLVTLK